MVHCWRDYRQRSHRSKDQAGFVGAKRFESLGTVLPMIFRHALRSILLIILFALSTQSLWAQAEEATATVWHRDIVTFRAPHQAMTPQQRAEIASNNLERIPKDELLEPLRSEYDGSGDAPGIYFTIGDHFLFKLYEDDLTEGSRLREAEKEVLNNLRAYIDARSRQGEPQTLLFGIGITIGLTFALVVIFKVLAWYRRWVIRFCVRWISQDKKLIVRGVDFREQTLKSLLKLLLFLSWIVLAISVYLYLIFVLNQFPYTESWGRALGGQVLGVLTSVGAGFIRSIPNFIVLGLIFVIFRGLIRLVKYTFSSLAESADNSASQWLQDDTRRATQRVINALLWIIGIVVAYPYIPGSDSAAFQGISVLVGLMVSLGSTGLVNQVVSGFVVLYSGAVRSGEYVHMADVEGTLMEVGLLSCKVLTPRGELVTVPNAVIMTQKTTNFSRLAKKDGAIFAISVGIGYDAPWRQVHRLLEEAVGNCKQIRDKPTPRILQEELGDFAVKYTVVFNVDDPQRKPRIMTELYGKIQDVFARENIQIMSPHFVGQPEAPVIPDTEKR